MDGNFAGKFYKLVRLVYYNDLLMELQRIIKNIVICILKLQQIELRIIELDWNPKIDFK